MNIAPWDKKLGEFLDMVEGNEIGIDERYQRSNQIWPAKAKSFLVETVIQNFALPHLMLHKTRLTRGSSDDYSVIIDGQQRTTVLLAFRNDKFEINCADRRGLLGKKYSTLRPQDRAAFDNYQLRIDRFENATEREIRTVFRRINFYTAPLNPSEQRHAKFQGEFKWFVHGRKQKYSSIFLDAGVLSKANINRMDDAKLITDISHAMINGVTTTNAKALMDLYEKYDNNFESERDFIDRFDTALLALSNLGPLPKRIAKHFQAYCLILALMEIHRPLRSLASLRLQRRSQKSAAVVAANLSTLAAVLDLEKEDVPEEYEEFYDASSGGTNVKKAREIRLKWFHRALTTSTV